MNENLRMGTILAQYIYESIDCGDGTLIVTVDAQTCKDNYKGTYTN